MNPVIVLRPSDAISVTIRYFERYSKLTGRKRHGVIKHCRDLRRHYRKLEAS